MRTGRGIACSLERDDVFLLELGRNLPETGIQEEV
jgi:hypothetical protein